MTKNSSAAALRALHVPGTPVVLPNVWDAASAGLVAEAGFAAVATSSGAVAEALGRSDQEGAPVAEMFAVAERVAAAVDVPVTVDAEAGYGLGAEEFVRRLLATGAVGCNLEDTAHTGGRSVRRDAAEQAAWLAAVRAAAGDRLVINARVDGFIAARAAGMPESEALGDVLDRARRYAAAGADCVYPILAAEERTIDALVTGLGDVPVNANPRPDGPSIARLADLGVARISLGTGLWRAQQSWLRATLTGLTEGRLPGS